MLVSAAHIPLAYAPPPLLRRFSAAPSPLLRRSLATPLPLLHLSRRSSTALPPPHPADLLPTLGRSSAEPLPSTACLPATNVALICIGYVRSRRVIIWCGGINFGGAVSFDECAVSFRAGASSFGGNRVSSGVVVDKTLDVGKAKRIKKAHLRKNRFLVFFKISVCTFFCAF